MQPNRTIFKFYTELREKVNWKTNDENQPITIHELKYFNKGRDGKAPSKD
jgi:hypothetical protein